MSQYNLRVMLLLCGFYVIVGLFTMVVLQLVPSGDSTIQRQSNGTPLSIQNK
jgi:hypothetical protein